MVWLDSREGLVLVYPGQFILSYVSIIPYLKRLQMRSC